ncbi:TetR/AcrR family transcriptional regulator [Acidocella sp.]|uniref:TetR/AcrR family transcriptional regulator n=1 Tax=Acidocella sp. TaxID=50710 RepID=UPI00260BAD06|nr:TetR/AcrR family transcriptional regulator [Acidocella sp.]
MKAATILFSGKAEKPQRTAGRGPGRPTREQIIQRNQELLDRSLDLFLQSGFEATTIDAISSAIGMSRRTIYSRYGDKTTLFKAALQQAIDEWIVPVAQLQAAETGDLQETLLRIARLWVAKLRAPAGMRLLRIANTEIFRMPEIAAYLWERMAEPTSGYLAELFRRRLRPGAAEVPDATDAAGAFLLMVVLGAVQSTAWESVSHEAFDRQIEYRTRLFLAGARDTALAAEP